MGWVGPGLGRFGLAFFGGGTWGCNRKAYEWWKSGHTI